MVLAQWRARRASKAVIEQIRGEIVAAARRRELYEALGAPDRIDGRFELLTLHAGLVLRRLAALGGVADAIGQDLVDSLFLHFDDTLREIGYSDVGVAKRLKTMGSAFYGQRRLRGCARRRLLRRPCRGARPKCLRRCRAESGSASPPYRVA
jgi:cytochrome b pre-mRNA-processing protein 3